MNTLVAQRARLVEELKTAQHDLKSILKSENPSPSIISFYEDLITRHKQLVCMIDEHLEWDTSKRKQSSH